MNVLVYLYYPYFTDHLAGGVQFVMHNFIREISAADTDIHFKIVCPQSNEYPIEQNENILPVLHDFEVDGLHPIDIKKDIELLENLANEADMIWLVDRNYPIITKKPKLLSLFTLGYERELRCFFETDWKEVVFISNYLKNKFQCCIKDDKRTSIIPFYCTPEFTKKDRKESLQRMKKYFDVDERCKYIVFPHRADPVKGHVHAIKILAELIKHDDSYRLLMPLPATSRMRDQEVENEYVESLKQMIVNNNIMDRVIFHQWVMHEDLPYYFSLGEYALFLSHLTETFGVTLLNAICCEIPVISYGIGALSEIIPPGNGHKVFPFGEIDQAVKCILENKEKELVSLDTKYALETYTKKPIINEYCKVLHRIV